ncbi:MAG: PEP-CTERM sorting domain-containing protein, partial [Opitutus sp.]
NFGTFLGHFATNLDRGVIGFDANPLLTSRTINTALDLSRFNSTTPNFYIGTSTSLVFGSGASITLPVNATAYRFAAYNGGRLQIDTVLGGAKGLIIGDPLAPLTQVSSSGVVSSVVLNAANTFGGGATLYAGNLYLGTSTVLGAGIVSGPLGTGTLTVASNQYSGRPALRVFSAPVTLDNPIVLNSALDVSSDLTFNGAISGSGSLRKLDAGTTTISGVNSSWVGGIFINQGGVTFTQDASAGTGKLTLGGTLASIATFLSATPNIGSLAGNNALDQLILADNSGLGISQAGKTQFMGVISGTAARMAVQGLDANVANQLTLGGANTYTGGTTIGPNVVLIAANNNSLGTSGTVTLNGGTLAVASNVTSTFNSATHSLVVNSGRLSGTGTFVFDASLDVKSGINGGVVLSPGFTQPGILNLGFTPGATLILNSGGSYNWKLMDATATSGGWDRIAVVGGVDVTATTIAPFNLSITSVGTDGTSASATNFDLNSSYSWTLLSATSITGFDPTKFSIDTSLFLNQTLDGKFSLALDGSGTNLMLNYTAAAIPEPSTWALMITGVAALAVQSLRRQRR